MGNGDGTNGDGFRYRGRSYIQLTMENNYEAFDKFADDDILSNPDLVATKYSLMAAGWFFWKNNLCTICDRGKDRATVEAVSRCVNGGLIGIEDRWSHFQKYHSILT